MAHRQDRSRSPWGQIQQQLRATDCLCNPVYVFAHRAGCIAALSYGLALGVRRHAKPFSMSSSVMAEDA